MENNETHNEHQGMNSEAYSYPWYPTQLDKNMVTSNASLSQDAFRVMKTEEDEELVVIEQRPPEQASRNSSQFVVNIGNKFTDQQVKTLMKSWKELCDKRQHIRTCDSDWHHITDKVNMAPGTAKSVKQVKKKFKNLRDRYRAFKLKNNKLNVGYSKSLSFSHFELVYGEIDSRRAEAPHLNSTNNALNKSIDSGGTALDGDTLHTTLNGDTLHATYPVECIQPVKRHCTSESFNRRSSFHPVEKVTSRTALNNQVMLSPSEVMADHPGRSDLAHNLKTKPKRAISSSENENDYQMGSTSPLKAISVGGRQAPNSDIGGQFDSGLASAVRELQQQQITMQRELMRNMKQMEERIIQEVSNRTREIEDRFRQQIANALTQLGNLMRIV